MTAREEAAYYKALDYATQKHSGQVRIGGGPYITHPVAVAQMVRQSGYGLDYQIAALFHDLLEDTDATKAEIVAMSNGAVLAAVVLLTKQKGYNMQEYIAGIRGNAIAKAVKAADRLHNLQSAFVANQEFKRKYILETLDWYMDFDPEIPKVVKALAQTLEQPITELSLLYEPIEPWNVENEFTVEQAMKAPSVEALLVLARENGIILHLENATELYAALHRETGALPDEALDAATGGYSFAPMACPICHAEQIGIVQQPELRYKCSNPQCGFTWGIGV